MTDPDRALNRLAARQFSCFSRAQATRCGFSNSQIRNRVEQQRWLARFDGSFQLAGTPTTGPTILRPHGRGQPLEGVDIRQSTSIPPHHVTFLDDQVVGGRLRIGQVERVFGDLAKPGRPGTLRVAQILDRRIGGYVPSESELEARFEALCRRRNVPLGVPQMTVPWGDRSSRERIDVGYPAVKVIVELDGRTYHGQLEAFQRDRLRDQLAAAAGWCPIRFTWWQITREPAFVVTILRAVLALDP